MRSSLRSSLLFLITVAAPCLTGCNALLGNDEGIGSSVEPGEADKNTAGNGTDDGDASTSSVTKKKDASTTGPSDDSKPPCTNCEPELITDQVGRVTSLQVTATHVYWATANGAYRIALSAAPCKKTDCFEKIDTGDFGQVSVAVGDTNVYWSTSQEFGYADLATMKSKKVDATTLKPSGSVMSLVGDDAYYVQSGYSIGSQATLVRGNALKLATGTGGISPISESSAGIQTFTATSDYVAWATEARRVYVQPTGQKATELQMPSDVSGWWITSLSVYKGNAYISAMGNGGHILRAPLDGSEEATSVYNAPGRHIVVNAGGAFIAFGDYANGVSNGIGWNPIDPNAAGAADGKVLTELDSAEVMKMQVTNDAVYYATYSTSSGGAAGIWKIAFDR